MSELGKLVLARLDSDPSRWSPDGDKGWRYITHRGQLYVDLSYPCFPLNKARITINNGHTTYLGFIETRIYRYRFRKFAKIYAHRKMLEMLLPDGTEDQKGARVNAAYQAQSVSPPTVGGQLSTGLSSIYGHNYPSSEFAEVVKQYKEKLGYKN